MKDILTWLSLVLGDFLYSLPVPLNLVNKLPSSSSFDCNNHSFIPPTFSFNLPLLTTMHVCYNPPLSIILTHHHMSWPNFVAGTINQWIKRNGLTWYRWLGFHIYYTYYTVGELGESLRHRVKCFAVFLPVLYDLSSNPILSFSPFHHFGSIHISMLSINPFPLILLALYIN